MRGRYCSSEGRSRGIFVRAKHLVGSFPESIMAGRNVMPAKTATTKPIEPDSEEESTEEDEDSVSDDDDDDDDDEEEQSDEEESDEEDSEEQVAKKPPQPLPKSDRKMSTKKPEKKDPKNQKEIRTQPLENDYVGKTEFDEVKFQLKSMTEERLPAVEQSLENLKMLLEKINSKLERKQESENLTVERKEDQVMDSEPEHKTAPEGDIKTSTTADSNNSSGVVDNILACQKEHSEKLQTLLDFMELYKTNQNGKADPSDKQRSMITPWTSSGAAPIAGTAIRNSDQVSSLPTVQNPVQDESLMKDLDEESRLRLCSKLIEMRKLSFAELISQLNR
ncbi:hypothetical protein D915_000885 [Fasciola hepatica]|uniref:Uncharacterized protein n=1 Tax=Fasciola hepatica TaxID=6192 RepID=A0A4E0RKF4_FASHE|nr:hypothetical protein D915_000885 [Fasciola hepatica]